MGGVDVFLIEPLDIFVGKLFSNRRNNGDDLRMLSTSQDRTLIQQRLASASQSLLSDATRRSHAETNWYVLFGENLPPTT